MTPLLDHLPSASPPPYIRICGESTGSRRSPRFLCPPVSPPPSLPFPMPHLQTVTVSDRTAEKPNMLFAIPDPCLKEKHDVVEAERQHRKLEEDAEELERQRRKLEEVVEEVERQRRKLEEDFQEVECQRRKLEEEEDRLHSQRSKKPNPRSAWKHAAVVTAEGNPEDSSAVVEPNKGKMKKNNKKKDEMVRIEQNSLPENAGGAVTVVTEGFGDLTVDGAEENVAFVMRGGKGRGRKRRTESFARLCRRAVSGLGVECGIQPNVMPTVVQELEVEVEGNVEIRGVSHQVAAVREELKRNAADRNVQVQAVS